MLTLVVESVDSVDGRALVVSSQQEEVLRVLHLVREQEADRLNRNIDIPARETFSMLENLQEFQNGMEK